jgi:trans-aconitate methyltransferase
VSFESWQSTDYAAAWAAEDIMAPVLELPRRISAALVADAGLDVSHVVDLGAGPGTYLRFMLETFPAARGTWVDVSEAMLELANEELASFADRIGFVVADLELLVPARFRPAEVVVSSRALHHFSPESLRLIYGAIAAFVAPGGFVFNLDHVGSPDDSWGGAYRRVREEMIGRRAQALKPHRQGGPLPTQDVHLQAMSAAGLVHADTPWRLLMTALMMARKPE